MERDMYAVARCLDRNPTFGLLTKAKVILNSSSIFDEYESFEGSTERIKFILMRFATNTYFGKVDSYKETALHLAAYYGHTKLVALLIDAAKYLHNDDLNNPKSRVEAFVRQVDDKMNTALHLAVRKCYVDIVKLLVEADPSVVHIQNNINESPMYLAASLGCHDIVKVICRLCTAPTFDGPGSSTVLHVAIKMRPEAKRLENDVVEVIIKAAKRSFSPEQFGAFVRRIDNNEDSALHLAVRGNHLDVVKLIVQDADQTKRNKDLKSPMYIAAEQGNKDIVELLCETCEFGNAPGPGGKNALHAAVLGGDPDCIEFILRKAEDLVICGDEQGLTPLWLATQKGQTSTVKKLVELLPEDSCNTVNHDGRNILHFAAFQSDKEMIKCILGSCPERYINKILNEKDINGDTPLHLLIREGCFEPELINHIEINNMAKNKQHYTALDMLYLEDHIIADQLQIKKALDTSSNWVSNKPSNRPESLVPPSKRLRKDVEFKIAEEKLNKKGLELYRERTSTQIIVTALITTVTFTVGFTMPGGYQQSGEVDEGMAVLSKKTAFSVFMVADALALVLSITSLFLYFISSMYQDTQKVAKLNAASTGLNIVSVMSMMLTFIAGTYLVLAHSQALAITVCVICGIFFLLLTGLCIQMLYDRRKMIYDRIRVQKYEA